MGDASGPPPVPRAGRLPVAALVLLGAAVLVGAFFFGAPPRQSAPSAAPGLRTFLESLGPLAIVEACVALALAALAVAGCLRHEAPVLPGGREAVRVRRPLVLLLALAALHLVPLPQGALGLVAPFSAETYAALTPAGDAAARPLSLWPDGTLRAVFTLAAMLAASVAVWTVVRDRTSVGDVRGSARAGAAVLAFVLGVAVLESAYGLCETHLGSDRILGFEKVSNAGSVTGTFIHRLMLGVWAGMGVCAAGGLAVGAVLGGKRHGQREKATAAAALLACMALCAGAAVLARSRIGHAALLAGGSALVALLAPVVARAAGRRWAVRLVAAIGAIGAAGGLAAAASEPVRERFGHLFRLSGLHDPRFAAWGSTLDLWREAPLVGTGMGSFGRAIHTTQSVDNPEELWFAHSDPLNLLSDAGLIGFVLAVWWLLALLRRGLPAARHVDVRVASVSAGALAGALVVLVASLGDFQTQFPVVAIPFAALLTVPAALAAPPGEDAAASARVIPWILPPRGLAALAAAAFGLLAAVPVLGAVGRARAHDSALPAAPTEAERLLHAGRTLLLTIAQAPPEERVERLERAEASLRRATFEDPLLDGAHLWLAHASLLLDRDRDDVLRSLGRARLVSRGHAEVNAQIGSTYLHLLGTEPAPYGPEGDSALAALREAGALKEGLFSRAWARCADLPLEERVQVVPDRAHAQMTLGDFLAGEGRGEQALAAYTRALELEPWNPQAVERASRAFGDAGREEEGRTLFERVGATWPR